MNKFTTMKFAAVMLPALAMGIPMVQAADDKCECPCDAERTTAMNDSKHEHQRTEMHQDEDQPARSVVTSASSNNKSSKVETAHDQYLAILPTGGYHSDSLIGREVMNRNNDKTIGEVSNLVFDADGQIVALIVSVGGVLGLGERDVAIAWNQFDRGHDGEQAILSINVPESSLKDAPNYVIKK